MSKLNVGVFAGLLAAVLFGMSAPLIKVFLGDVDPWLLAGLLYSASGLALGSWQLVRRVPFVRLSHRELGALLAAIGFGGVLGPVLLLVGLQNMPASGAALLLNAEGVFTAGIAWVVFRENVDRRILLGFASILVGAAVLGWSTSTEFSGVWPGVAVLGACLCWGIDNNLTRQVSLSDATWLAAIKGLAAGPTNLVLAFLMGVSWPSFSVIAGGSVIGVLSYGVSLALFIVALRYLGTVRAGAYFSVAPFFGAVLAVLFGEPITGPLVVAGTLMAIGVWLHLTEKHHHLHVHRSMSHEHWHTHDDGHHEHEHELPVSGGHVHVHVHAQLSHAHPHFPDAHHRHDH